MSHKTKICVPVNILPEATVTLTFKALNIVFISEVELSHIMLPAIVCNKKQRHMQRHQKCIWPQV